MSDATVPARAMRPSAGVTFAAKLEFRDICHAFPNGTETLRDVSLVAEPGEVLCLLGPSGSGKTTLLRIAAGIEVQTTGTLLLNDREIAGPNVFVPPESRSIGLVFQDFALFPHLTILDNVRFGLTRLSRAEASREAMQALSRVGLEAYAKNFPHALSGGEQQRVALARALAPRPNVLLLDEPFSGLDSRLRDSVRAETLATLRQSRATAVVVTHDAEEAMRLADRIALMKDGRIVQTGRAEELFRKPASLFAAGFFSEINVFESRCLGGMVETPLGRFDAAACSEGSRISVVVRVGAVVASEKSGDVQARVLSRRFLGHAEAFEFAVGGADQPVRARIACGVLPENVRDVWLSAQRSDVLVFESADESA